MTSPILLNKPIGMTPLECIEKYRQEHSEYQGVKMTYAGRLDPMAEGLLLILTGEDCHKKDDYLGLDKTYEATILLGIKTDSLDLLGLADKDIQTTQIDDATITQSCKELIGTHSWPYPAFSSKPVQGKPLFQWTRENALDQIDIPVREMTIKSLELNTVNPITSEDLLKTINHRIPLVQGDFRQEEILEAWKHLLSSQVHSFQTITFTTTVTSGTYIRTLAEQIGNKLNTPTLLLSLNRSNVGNYHL